MAIGKTFSKVAQKAGKFLKDKGKQAIRISQKAKYKAGPTIQKAKDVTTKAGTKIKLGAKKISESKAAKTTVAKTKEGIAKAKTIGSEAKAKIVAKTPEKIKKPLTKVGAELAGFKAGTTAVGEMLGRKAGTSTGKFIDKTKKTIEKKFGPKFLKGKESITDNWKNVADAMDEAADAPANLIGSATMAGSKIGSKVGKTLGAIVGSPTANILGAGALTASIMASNNNPKSDYEMKRSGDGFQLKFNDEGKNKILTGKSLSQKQVDEVRSIIAFMESIIVSDNPKARQKEFIAAMDQLSGYGVNSVVGKNLMINMPQSFANPRNW